MTRYMEPIPGHYDASDPFWSSPGAIRHHLGSDYNGVPAGTWFAVCADGEVVVNQWSSVLGNLLGIRHDDGKFMGYAHQLVPSPLTVGSRVTIGQGGGQVGDTGSASNGAHLHISLGDTINAIFGIGVEDPHDYIVKHLTDTAGSGGTPIATPLFTEEEMSGLQEGIYVAEQDAAGKWVRGLIAGPSIPGGVIVATITDQTKLGELQAMGNLAGVRTIDSAGNTPRLGAPLKYARVGTGEFDATVTLCKKIWA